ncbi:hypothetical protein KC866_02210 [Patescibacteria group bacterium]|nr:hypothetical protein [Patescibacteria group bacterium]
MEEFKIPSQEDKQSAQETVNSLIQGPDGIMRTPEQEKDRIEGIQNER